MRPVVVTALRRTAMALALLTAVQPASLRAQAAPPPEAAARPADASIAPAAGPAEATPPPAENAPASAPSSDPAEAAAPAPPPPEPQGAVGVPESAGRGQAPQELERVTVTATKQSTSYEKVMASVSSIDGKFIAERAVSNFVELTDYTPNVQINVSGSAGQFIIRGLGTPDTNAGFDPSVGTVVDGVYFGRANFLSAFFNDIDRFEVLRGPQGTLFGKNSTAGLFNITTQRPGRKFKFEGQMLARGYGDISIRPAVSIPLGKDFGIRYSGNYQNGSRGTLYNTFLERPEQNEEQSTSRIRMRYGRESRFVVDAQVFSSHFSNNNSGFVLTTLSPEMRAAILRYDPEYSNVVEERVNSTNFGGIDSALNQGASLSMELPLPSFGGIDNFRIASITAFARSRAKNRNIDADFTPIPFIRDELFTPQIYRQLSQEIRATGTGKDLFGAGYGISFITGVYFLEAAYKASDLFTLESFQGAIDYCTAAAAGNANCNGLVPGGAGGVAGQLSGPIQQLIAQAGPALNNQNVRTILDQDETALAGFGQVEYKFLPRWAAIAGLRYGVQSKSALLSAQASSEIVRAIAGSDNYEDFLEREERDFSPKLGVRLDYPKDVSSYFTWARGFKSGGFNGLPLRQTQNEYGPEQASSFEFGTKARLAKGKLRFSTSLFYTTFDDLQVSTFLNNRFIVLNAATARSQGAEFDLQWLPSFARFLFIRASAGYVDARYTDYRNGPCFSDATPGEGNCRITTPPPNPLLPCMEGTNPCAGAQDLTGGRLPYGSEWTASIAPNVFFPLGNGLQGTIGVDWLYRSDRFLDVDLDPRKLQGDTHLFNLLLTVNDESKKWGLTFAVRNLTDITFNDQRVGQPLAPGNFASNGLNEERTFSQSISYAF